MSPAPVISVVLPVYNAGDVLARAVDSILAQSERDFELLVIDDGSTDDSAAVACAFGARDARLRLLSGPHRGIVDALNRGLAVARGRYIARMDADDESHPDRLRRQRALLDEHPEVGLASCRAEYGGDPAGRRGYAAYVAWTNGLLTHEDIALNRFVESPLAHPTVLFRSDVVEAGGAYREGPFPEDYELWLRWLERGVRMEKLPETLLRWNDAPDRLSRRDPRCSTDAFYRCKTGYLARWLERHNPRHPEVWVWGAGRTTRRRAELLADHGIRIAGYVDIDPARRGTRIGGRPVLLPEELAGPGEVFVLPYVGSRGAREAITAWLKQRGFGNGRDFICAA